MDSRLALLFLVVSGCLGAAIGSFLNVCIYRLPRPGLSISRPPRSFCPSCGTGIAWYDNLPVASWLLLGGRCRQCRSAISLRYLVVEALTALLFVLVARRYLLQENCAWAAYAAVCALAAAMVVSSFIDIDLRIIPDEITLPGLLAAPFLVLLAPEIQPVDRSLSWVLVALNGVLEPMAPSIPAFLRRGAGLGILPGAAGAAFFLAGLFGYARYWRWAHPDLPRPLRDGLLGGVLAGAAGVLAALNVLVPGTLLEPRVFAFWAALAGMLAGSSLVLAVGIAGSKLFRKPAMGYGDVKLMGLLGAFTGWAGVVEGFFMACFLGSLVGVFLLIRYRSRYLPFGPFLTAGCLLGVLWPEAIERLVRWYMTLF